MILCLLLKFFLNVSFTLPLCVLHQEIIQYFSSSSVEEEGVKLNSKKAAKEIKDYYDRTLIIKKKIYIFELWMLYTF